MCNTSEAMVILSEAMQRTKETFGNSVVNGYLYGSYARGDYDDESDVDIFLVIDQSEEVIRSYNKSLFKIDSDLSLKYNVTVSVTARSTEQFNKYSEVSPFYRNIIREGIRYVEH